MEKRDHQSALRRTAVSLCGLGLLLLAFLSPQPGEAAISSCSVSTAGVAFSPYDTVTKAAVDEIGTITVTCTGSGTESMSIMLSGGNANSCSPRQMRSGAATLSYHIYRDSARTANWCEGGNRLDISFNFTTPTLTQSYTMYGRIPSGQNPAAGVYSDALTVAVRKGGSTLASSTAPIGSNVFGSCSVSATTLGFGNYSPMSTLDSVAYLSANCTVGTAYSVSLGGGQYLSGGSRRMLGGSGNHLSYALFSDSGRQTPWGDGSALGAKRSGTGSGGAQSLPVYGRIGSNQYVRPGSYSDNVQVTVEY